ELRHARSLGTLPSTGHGDDGPGVRSNNPPQPGLVVPWRQPPSEGHGTRTGRSQPSRKGQQMADETSDAVTREAAWLAQSYDSLPALLKSAGGRWDVVQGYWPGDGLARGKCGIYVTRARVDDDHPSAWRYRPRHIFRLKLIWPIEAAATSAAD